MTDHTEIVLSAVRQERKRQNALHGEQKHPLPLFVSILMGEVGEVAQEVQHCVFLNEPTWDLRNELIQVAAVAVAMAEMIDRNEDAYDATPHHNS